MTTTAKKGSHMTDWRAEVLSVPGLALIGSFLAAFIGWRGTVAWRAAVLDRAVRDIQAAREDLDRIEASDHVTDLGVARQLSDLNATMRSLEKRLDALERRMGDR